MSTKKILLTLSFGFLCALFSFSQEDSTHTIPDIRWGEMNRKQGRLLYLLPNAENEFYALRWSGGRLFGGYKVTKHKDLELINSSKIRLVADESIANFEGASIINGNFVVFLSDKKEGKNHFYMQEFDENLEKKEVVHLASYDLERNQKAGSFRFRRSPNQKFFRCNLGDTGKKRC